MATLTSLRQGFLSVGICLLVSLLLPSAYVKLGLVPEHEFAKTFSVRSEKVSEEVAKHLSTQGFSIANIEKLQKCGLLCGKSAEARLQSRILWLLQFNQNKEQVRTVIALPCLKQTVRWLSDMGIAQDDFVKSLTCSSVFVISAKQNLEPTVLWLLDLGLRQPHVVKIIVSSPEIIGFSVVENSKAVRFLMGQGLSRSQSANVIARCPDILGKNKTMDLSRAAQCSGFSISG